MHNLERNPNYQCLIHFNHFHFLFVHEKCIYVIQKRQEKDEVEATPPALSSKLDWVLGSMDIIFAVKDVTMF